MFFGFSRTSISPIRVYSRLDIILTSRPSSSKVSVILPPVYWYSSFSITVIWPFRLSAPSSDSSISWSTKLETRSEEHTSELQSRGHLVCRLLLEKKKHHIVNFCILDLPDHII